MAQAFVEGQVPNLDKNELEISENLKIKTDEGNVYFTISSDVEGVDPVCKVQSIFTWRKFIAKKDTINTWLEAGTQGCVRIHGNKYAEVRYVSGDESRVGIFIRSDEGKPIAHRFALSFSVENWHKISQVENVAWIEISVQRVKAMKDAIVQNKANEKKALKRLKENLPTLADTEDVLLFTWKWKDTHPREDAKYFFRKDHARENAILDPDIETHQDSLQIYSESIPSPYKVKDFLEYAYAYVWARECKSHLDQWARDHPGQTMELSDKCMDSDVTVPKQPINSMFVFFYLHQGIPCQDFQTEFDKIDIESIEIKALAINLFMGEHMIKMDTPFYYLCKDIYDDYEAGKPSTSQQSQFPDLSQK